MGEKAGTVLTADCAVQILYVLALWHVYLTWRGTLHMGLVGGLALRTRSAVAGRRLGEYTFSLLSSTIMHASPALLMFSF